MLLSPPARRAAPRRQGEQPHASASVCEGQPLALPGRSRGERPRRRRTCSTRVRTVGRWPRTCGSRGPSCTRPATSKRRTPGRWWRRTFWCTRRRGTGTTRSRRTCWWRSGCQRTAARATGCGRRASRRTGCWRWRRRARRRTTGAPSGTTTRRWACRSIGCSIRGATSTRPGRHGCRGLSWRAASTDRLSRGWWTASG